MYNVLHMNCLSKYVYTRETRNVMCSVYLLGIAFSHEKRENGKFVDEKFLTGKSDEKNGKLSSLK